MRGVAVTVSLAACALLAACYSPSPPAGIPCGPDLLCPSGLSCSNGVCGGEPSDGTIMVDAACGACSADGTQFVPCTGAPITCSLGCSTTGGDHCVRIQPSNDVDPASTSMTDDVAFDGDTTVFVDTGEISGGFTRAAGEGVIAGVRYAKLTSGGVEMGVFAFGSLAVKDGTAIVLEGTRALVVFSEGDLVLGGFLDGSAGCGMDRSCPGPGGGAGGRMGAPASGPCSAGDGATGGGSQDDGGGGGGGGAEGGGKGGIAPGAAGGTAGAGCMTPELIPLLGGGGGGAGGPGGSAFSVGGGGGGAIELVSQTKVEVTAAGVVFVGGNGGDGGHSAGGSNAGAGGGGGGGGGVLIEAPNVVIAGKLIANGGSGGGGGNSGVGSGGDGNNANKDATVAAGGIGVATPNPGTGGDGGAATSAPTAGGDSTNGGGGGGARGTIRVNAVTKNLGGTISPTATTGNPATK